MVNRHLWMFKVEKKVPGTVNVKELGEQCWVGQEEVGNELGLKDGEDNIEPSREET